MITVIRFFIDDRKCPKQLRAIYIYQAGYQTQSDTWLFSGIPKAFWLTYFWHFWTCWTCFIVLLTAECDWCLGASSHTVLCKSDSSHSDRSSSSSSFIFVTPLPAPAPSPGNCPGTGSEQNVTASPAAAPGKMSWLRLWGCGDFYVFITFLEWSNLMVSVTSCFCKKKKN